MKNCNIDINNLYEQLNTILETSNDDNDFKNKIIDMLTDIGPSVLNEIKTTWFLDEFTPFLNEKISKSFFSSDQWTSIVENINHQDTKLNISFSVKNKSDHINLQDNEQAKSSNYLVKYFGFDTAAQRKFRDEQESKIYEKILIDSSEPAYKTFNTSTQNINEQIKKLQREYLDTIIKYAVLYGADENELNNFKDTQFDKTGAIKKLQKLIGNHFNFNNQQIASIGTLNEDTDATQAYFAYVALINFDSLLKDIFGESIQLPANTYNEIYEGKEYKFVPIAEMSDSWRDESTIVDDSNEIGKLTRFVISMVPIVQISSRSNESIQYTPIPNQKLTYKRFCNAFIKIFDAINNPEIRSQFSSITVPNDSILRKKILGTQEYLERLSLYDAICKMPSNFSYYAPIVLYMLTQNNNEYFNSLVDEEQKALVSILRGVFDCSNSESLKTLHLNANLGSHSTDVTLRGVDAQSQSDYYLYVLQTLSSLGKQTLGTYMLTTDENGENASIQHTTLATKDFNYRYTAFVKALNGRCDAKRNYFTNQESESKARHDGNDIVTEVAKFGITFHKEIKCIKDQDKKYYSNLSISLQKDNYTLTISPTGYKFFNQAGMEISAPSLLLDTFADFFNVIFPADLSRDSEFRMSYQNDNTLASLLTTITFRQAVNETVFSEKKTGKKIKQEIEQLCGSQFSSNLRKNNNQLEMISSSMTSFLRKASEIYDIIEGITGDQMVSDNEQNKISLIKLSQASCKEHYLWSDARSNIQNPTSHFILYEVFAGSEFLRDFKDYSGNVLKMTNANPAELFTSNILYDFLLSAINYDKVYIIGPIISDKPNILRITIDLNIPINKDKTLTLRDLLLQKKEDFADTFRTLLIQEWGAYYEKQYNFVKTQYDNLQIYFNQIISEILETYDLLENFDKSEYINCLSQGFLENFESLNAFVNKLYNIYVKESFIGDPINAKDLLKSLIHECVVRSQNINPDHPIKFRDGLMGHFEGQNWRSNHLLIDGLYRYTNLVDTSISEEYKAKYWSEYGPYKPDTLSEYNSRIVTDLLKLGSIVHLPNAISKQENKNLNEILKLATTKDFIKNDNLVIVKLIYRGETIDIVSGDDYRRSQFGKDVSDMIKYGLIEPSISFADFNNTEFDFEKLMEYFYVSFPDLEDQITTPEERFANELKTLEKIRKIVNAFYGLSQQQKNELISVIQQVNAQFQINNSEEDFIKNKIILDELIQLCKDNAISSNLQTHLGIDLNDINIPDEIELPDYEFNDFLTKYNALSMLIWEEYTTSIVGHYLNHPYTKNGKGSIEDFRAAAITAQNKRNVSFTATKHQILLNQLNGLGDHFYSMTVEDLEDFVYNLVGDKIKVDADGNITPMTWPSNDGASFITKAHSILVNNSLQNERVGHDKKLFGHRLYDDSGTGYIDKTCAFELSNERLRDSLLWNLLNKQMYSFFQLDSDIDITKDYYGRDINYDDLDIYYCELTNSNIDGTPIKQWYKVKNIEHITTNDGERIRITRQSVGENIDDKTENDQANLDYKDVKINSVYDLWKYILGGEFSGHYQKEGTKIHLIYENDDSSHENLVKLMNMIGYRRNYTNPENKYFNANEKPQTQHDVYQPLKRIVGEATTIGAIKQGPENVNSTEVYYDPNYNITITRVKANDYGPQLDAEHTAQDSYIAMMTQVMNAASARGYSIDQGSEIYRLLYEIAEDVIKPVIDSLTNQYSTNQKNNQQIQEVLTTHFANIIINSLKTSSATDSEILQAIGERIRTTNLSDNNEKINFIKKYIPIDSPQLLNQVISKISVALQKSAVRLRPQGNANVLVPSNGFVQLYDGHVLSYYGTPELAKKYLQEKQQSRELDEKNYIKYSGDIQLGGTYKYLENGEQKIIKLAHPGLYWKFLLDVATGRISNVILDITQPMDLSEGNFYFWDIEGKHKYQIWDLACIHKRWNIEIIIAKIAQKEQIENQISQLNNQKSISLSQEEKDKIDLQIATLTDRLNEINLLQENHPDPQQEKLQLIQELQEQLNNLDPTSLKNSVQVVVYNADGTYSYQNIIINKDTVSSKAFDVIVPKSFKDDFMLTYGDDLKAIADNPDFFFNKFKDLYNSASQTNEYDIALIGTNYSLYLAYDGSKSFEGYTEKKDIKFIFDNGKCYRVQEGTNDTMYEVPVNHDGKPDLRIYEDNLGNEIIVTKRISFFLNKQKYIYFRLSDTHTFADVNDKAKKAKEKHSEAQSAFIQELYKAKDELLNKVADLLLEPSNIGGSNFAFLALAIDEDALQNNYRKFVKAFDDAINAENIDQLQENVLYQDLINRSRIMHNSFLKSLEFIVSRTPAQCMQSFMSMRAVAFNNSDVNSMMVSRWQLFLQGSDFDVDKANVLTHAFKNGQYILWSPLQDYSKDNATRQASDMIPFPTGVPLENSLDVNAEYTLWDLIHIYRVYDTLPQHIYLKHLGQLINYINYHNVQNLSYYDYSDIYTEEQLNNLTETQFENLKSLINEHQMYFANDIDHELDVKEARLNRISTLIYQISINPVNWIQGWAPIDVVTDPVNEVADRSKKAKQSKNYTGRSVVSITEQLVNTMEGKKDVGIVANSLKVFEAISHSVYEILNHGSVEDIQYLLFDIDIAHKRKSIFANAYVQEERLNRLLTLLHGINPDLETRLKEALNNVDNISDAYTFLSALLSLAADNAKKPVLSTINAGTTMIGLYTAGAILGYNIEDLSNIINSETGEIIFNLLQGNAFYGDTGFNQLWQASKYLKSTPLEIDDYLFWNSLSFKDKGTTKSLLSLLGWQKQNDKKGIVELSPSEVQDKLGNMYHSTGYGRMLLSVLSSFAASLKQLSDIKEIGDRPTSESLKVDFKDIDNRQITRYLLEQLKATDEYKQYKKQLNAEENEDVKQALINEFNNSRLGIQINSLNQYKEGDNNTLVNNAWKKIKTLQTGLLSVLKNLHDVDQQKLKEYHKKLQEFLSKEYDYLKLIDIVKNDRYNGDIIFWNLDKLIKVNSEMQTLSSYTKLNQGYETKIFSQIAWVADLSRQIVDKMDPNKGFISKETRLKVKDAFEDFKTKIADENGYINVLKFVIDKQYQKYVIDFADKIKTAINPYLVVSTTRHYFGYLEGMVTLTHGSQSISSVYKALMEYAPKMFNYFNVYSDKDTQQLVKRMQQFFTHVINQKFFIDFYKDHELLFSFGETENISLLTEVGRQKFKALMDEQVFPYLIEQYADNEFVQQLTLSTYDRGLYHNTINAYSLLQSSIAQNDFQDSKVRAAKQGLRRLMAITLPGSALTIGQAIFLYNLIVYDNKIDPNSFTGFFDTLVAENQDEIIKSYNSYIGQYGITGQTLTMGKDFTEQELQIAIAPIITKKEALGKPKYPFAYVIDYTIKQPKLLKKVRITQTQVDEYYEDKEYAEEDEIALNEYSLGHQIYDNAYSSTGNKYIMYNIQQVQKLPVLLSGDKTYIINSLSETLSENQIKILYDNYDDLINRSDKDKDGNISAGSLRSLIEGIENSDKTCKV